MTPSGLHISKDCKGARQSGSVQSAHIFENHYFAVFLSLLTLIFIAVVI